MISVTQLRKALDELDIQNPDITKVGVISPGGNIFVPDLWDINKDLQLSSYHDGGEVTQVVWLHID